MNPLFAAACHNSLHCNFANCIPIKILWSLDEEEENSVDEKWLENPEEKES